MFTQANKRGCRRNNFEDGGGRGREGRSEILKFAQTHICQAVRYAWNINNATSKIVDIISLVRNKDGEFNHPNPCLDRCKQISHPSMNTVRGAPKPHDQTRLAQCLANYLI